MDDLMDFLRQNRIFYRTNVPLSGCTTFRIGGPAALCVYPDSPEQTAALIGFFSGRTPYFVVGRGSNLLAPDEGVLFPLIFTERLDALTLTSGGISAGAGVSLARLSNFAAENGIAGLEFLHGIPGSVGGGVFMNAGAYGGEVSGVLTESLFVDGEGRLGVRSLSEHQFSYRHSAYRPGEVLCSALFSGTPGNREEIVARMEELDSRRREKQPLEYPSAGSTFKRPEGCFAGKLIEDCGLKGFRVGDAQVSEKHAGFLINRGRATFREMIALIQTVQERVQTRFGVRLEPEVQILK